MKICKFLKFILVSKRAIQETVKEVKELNKEAIQFYTGKFSNSKKNEKVE